MKFLKLLIFSVIFFLPLTVHGQSQIEINATVSVCGDGEVTMPVESCEGLDLNGSSCSTLGFTNGFLSCTPTCTFDTSQCITVTPPVVVPVQSTSSSGSKKPEKPALVDQSNLCTIPAYMLRPECLDDDPVTFPVPSNCLPSPVPGFLSCPQENPLEISDLPILNQPDIFSPEITGPTILPPSDNPATSQDLKPINSESTPITASKPSFCTPHNFLYLNLAYLALFVLWFAYKNRIPSLVLGKNLAITIASLLSIISFIALVSCTAWNIVPLLLGVLFFKQILTSRW